MIGCGHKSGPPLVNAAPPVLPTGWTLASDPESGAMIGIPGGWRKGVPRSQDPNSIIGSMGSPEGMTSAEGASSPEGGMPAELQNMADQSRKEDDAMEQKTLQRLREKEGIVLHCVDGSKPIVAEEPTRIYVKKIPNAGYATLNVAAEAEQAAGHRSMKGTMVDLPVGKAWRLVAQGQNRIGDLECHVSYVFVDGDDAYVLRFASTNAPEAIMSIEGEVAKTFRVVHKAK